MSGYMESAAKTDWCTPKYIIDAAKEVLGDIRLDPCGNENSIVGAAMSYTLPMFDGLTASWNYATIYVNPPFGKGLRAWVQRCVDANKQHQSQVILLLPAAVDTKWWQELIFPNAGGICFLKGRIKFEGAQSSAPMACAIVYFGEYLNKFREVFSKLGTVR